MATGPSQPALRIERLPDIPAGAEDWRPLALASGCPFSTWEWASTWWRHYGAGREQRILGCRDADGALVGILPLYLASRRPLRVLRLVGHGDGTDQLGPICAPEHRDAVSRALKTALADSDGWDVCMVERLNSSDGWPDSIGGIVTRSEPSPAIRIETTDWDEHLASKSAHYRQQARRLERRLARDHTLEFRLAADPDRIGEDMETFFDLHDARWAAAGGSTSFAGELREFHHEIAALALAGGWLHLCFLELDGVPRAATYGFRLGGVDWYYQTGRDPDFDKERLGNVLLNNIVREAVCDGMREFRLLLGTHAYKDRLTTDGGPVVTVALTRNAPLRAAMKVGLATRRGGRSLARRAARFRRR